MDTIVRGYIIPKIDPRGDPVYVERISADEGLQMLDKLGEILDIIIKDFMESRGIDRISSVEDLYDLLNKIVITLRYSLYLDPIPDILPTPAYYLDYWLFRAPRKDLEEASASLRKIVDILSTGEIVKIAGEYTGKIYRALRDDVMNIMRYPADTRPAANTSSLLIHMLTTAAIASSLARNRNAGLRDITKIRIAALFHDVGKLDMRNWHRHEDISKEFVKKILGKYLVGDALALLEETLSEFNYPELRAADRIASNIDRLSRYLIEIVSPSTRRMLEEKARVYGKSFEKAYMEWAFWEGMSVDEIEEVTKDFCKNSSRIAPETQAKLLENVEVLNSDVLLVRFDTRGIQKYIRSGNLRAMSGASRVIETLNYTIIPLIIINQLGMPAETVLLFGGGNVVTVLPRVLLEKLEDVRAIINRELGIEVDYGVSEIYNSLPYMSFTLEKDLLRKKIAICPQVKRASYEAYKVEPNISYICDFCGIEPASERIEDHLVCDRCKIKYDVGDEIHFRYRVEMLKRTVPSTHNLEWEALAGRVMEFIAGTPYEDIQAGRMPEEYPAIALVRFDCNLVGQLIASSVSITDFAERSARIDYSVKAPIAEFMEYLRKRYQEDYARLALGLIYVGGDDGFLLCPSHLAIPMALHLVREFHRLMGYKATLSVGIAVGKPKHPLAELYESAGHLLNKYAKGKVRFRAARVHSEEARSAYDFAGALAFFTADGGVITRYSLDYVVEVYSRDRITLLGRDAYTLSSTRDAASIFRLIDIVFPGTQVDSFDFRRLVDDVESAWRCLMSGTHGNQAERLRRIRNYAMDIMMSSAASDYSIKVKILYSKREAETHKGEERGEYFAKILENLLIASGEDGPRLPVMDLIQLVKIIGGGFL